MYKRIEMTVFKYFMARLTTIMFRVTWQSCHCQSHCCSKWSQSSLSRCVHTAWLDCQSSARCSWPCCMGQYYAKKRKRKSEKMRNLNIPIHFFKLFSTIIPFCGRIFTHALLSGRGVVRRLKMWPNTSASSSVGREPKKKRELSSLSLRALQQLSISE